MKRLYVDVLTVAALTGAGCHGLSGDRIPRVTAATAARLSPPISAEDLRTDVTFLNDRARFVATPS
jgi:hypothetical protein